MVFCSTVKRCYSLQKTTFYVTTPIYYVNAAPHIGHLYSSVIADCIQRWRRLLDPGVNILFSTGTDEHGTKIQQAAANIKCPVANYCSDISAKYRLLSDKFGISFTNFIRTSDTSHTKVVQHFWETLANNGHIYRSQYSGWYCVPDETFLTESQLKEVEINDRKVIVSAESGHPVEWTEEENYMFKLSSFQSDLLHWYKENENIIKPHKFQRQLTEMLTNDNLPDVSISRPSSRVFWGIPVPGDATQTVYVWLDALVNYLTVAGYPDGGDDKEASGRRRFRDSWPPDVQVIGKDILKFHGIYWPAFLMAANLELPKTLLCHSHWTVDNEKMSKSKKNVVCPFNRSDLYTEDGLRYFLLREGVAHSDGNYSDIKLTRILNSELADTLGNLLSRCCGKALNPNQIFPGIDSAAWTEISTLDVTKKLIESTARLPDLCYHHYADYNFYKAIDATIATLHCANLFFETLKPWELRKLPEKQQTLDTVLHITMETLRICSIILMPVIPNLSNALLTKINVPEDERNWKQISELSWDTGNKAQRPLTEGSSVLFQRIQIDKEKRQNVGNRRKS